jgi:mRNA interferase RelE/StbE
LGWSIEYSGLALKQLKKLNRSAQAEILDYMDQRIAPAASPRDFGKALRHDKFGLWRYRVRDYRIICELNDKVTVVTVLAVGHRSTIYHD